MPTAGPETYLEVLEDLLGKRGLAVAHCGSKDTYRGSPGKTFLLLLFFLFVSFCSVDGVDVFIIF